MEEFIDPAIQAYATAKSAPEPAHLAHLDRQTHLKVLYPRMLPGAFQGRLLSFLSQMIQPHRILEIGTFTGYSSICLAEGLAEGGQVVTIDINPEREFVMKPAFEAAGVANKIKVHYGRALDVLPTIDGPFDLVFIDADKQNYLPYYQVVLPKVRTGGLIIVDNVLYYGRVLEKGLQDKETRGISAFNDFVAEDARVFPIMLPFGDGLTLLRKN
ncbi:MAG: O-methyltransferase [Bacteroidota bacterium]